MKSRLGFAISVSVDPEILIIDEALSVGDKAFAEKSLNKMREFKAEGKTMIFVSHSIGQMKKFCDKILWLEFGHVKEYGTVSEVIPKYETFLELWKKLTKKEREQYRINAVNQNHVNNEKLIKEKKQKQKKKENKYEERLISRLGRLRAKDSYIYETPKDETKRKASKSYKGSVYYIKKRAIFNDKTYYLLSNSPSAKHDIIGWMKSADLATYRHLNIDEDYKLLEVKGTGVGYDKPWGSKKNIIISDLAMYQNKQFHVDKTDRIGQNLWYCGILEDKRVWIHEKDLK